MDHRVAHGETMTEVATRYSTDVDTLKKSNPDVSDPDKLQTGQVLQVPIGEGYGSEPTSTELKEGQTLSELAQQVKLPLDKLIAANEHTIGDPNVIDVGQQIWIPGGYAVQPKQAPPPPTPLEQAAQNTDAAATRAAAAQKAYDDMSASTYGNGAALPYLAQNAADSKRALDDAVKTEVDLRAQPANLPPGHSPTEADYAAAEQAVINRTRTDPAVQQTLQASVTRVDSTRQAQNIVDLAKAQSDPAAALKSLSDGHKAATPEVQQALLINPGAQQIITDATNWALEPLKAGPTDDMLTPQAAGYQTMERLDQLTAVADPEIGARVMSNAAPAIEAAQKEYPDKYGTTPFGQGSVEHLTAALGRIAGTPVGDAVMDRYVKLGVWDRNGIVNAIANGASPAYALKIAQQPNVDAGMVMDTVYAGMGIFRDKVADDTKAYAKQMEELGWLVKSHGGAMTPEQLDKAIADYTAEKGPEWQKQTEALKQQLADDGEKLLAQVQALQNLPPQLSGEQGRVDEQIANTLNDTNAQLAISTALKTNPDLTAGAAGRQLLGFFTSTGFASNAKLTDQARRLTTEVTTAHVQSTLIARAGQLDPADPASVQRVTNAINSLRSPELAKAWGVSEDALDEALEKLKATIPGAAEGADDAAKRMKDYDAALKGINGFDKATLPGQLLRGAGLALAGVGVLASIERAGLDPTLKNDLRVVVDAAGLGQKGFELMAGLTQADSKSLAGRLGGSAASKFLGVLSVGLDGWSAVEAYNKGDIPSTVLYGASGAGGLMAAFGSGTAFGPIGIGLVVVSVIGLSVWNGVKEANKHQPDSDHGTSMRFLQHAGFSEEAARALCDQTGDGVSPVPILERYAELQGLNLADTADRQRFVDWVNAMPPEKLGALRDSLHRTIDEFDGDAGKLPATADNDDWVVPDIKNRPWFAYSGAAQPESAAQINAVLEVLGLRPLS